MKPLTVFHVLGPRPVPTYRGKAGRTITDDDVRRFWRDNADVATLRGCYVFAVRSGPRTTPAYVGKATRSFKREVFQYHKLTRYQQQLADSPSGTPVIFFVALARRRGAPPVRHVADLERYLIAAAVRANPLLRNVRGVEEPPWCIAGVVRRAPGTPSIAARAFDHALGLTRSRDCRSGRDTASPAT